MTGLNGYNYTPLFQPQMHNMTSGWMNPTWGAGNWNVPTWNPISFNGLSNWTNMGWGNYSESNTTQQSTQKFETADEYNARKKREYQAAQEKYNQKSENLKNLKLTNEAISEIEAGKKEDGSSKIEVPMDEYKKLPWWKKATRAAMNIFQGGLKLCTTFIGYEEDGSWNWKKGLKNVGIALGTLALTAIPVIGPVIGTALLYSGVVAGAVGVGMGINKAINAETVSELDHAFQDIGSGGFIGITSAIGIKGLGKSVAGSQASATGIKAFIRNFWTNPWKATFQSATQGKQAVAQTGFFKTWLNNLKTLIPKSARTKFEEQKQATINNHNDRIAKIDTELQTATGTKKGLLEQEKSLINNQIAELQNCTSKQSWMNLKKDSHSHKELQNLRDAMLKLETQDNVALGNVNLNRSNADDIALLKNLTSRIEALSKEMQVLSKQRYRSMRTMAFRPKKYKTEIEAYAGSSKTQFGYQWDINKGQLNLFTLPFKALWRGMNLMFKPWNYFDKSGSTIVYKIEQSYLPVYELNYIDAFASMAGNPRNFGGATILTAEQCQEQLLQLKTQKQQLEAALQNA